ncbi:DUF4333 domain-containing protein [Glycomyces salinus]|uniref:DUF4333 domain-containing protein n=1 Tax=Glycomyces salinus TaxID=980294 RepID=UPI0018EB5C6A|nr:DUF4333 domain-containing protein [Glycomyces salinus]
MRPLRLVLPLTLTVLAASACSLFSQTISGEDLSEAAADTLEPQLGERPEVDCGDDDITPAEGDEVDCTMIDPATDLELDMVVTFTGVDGDQWDIEVEVFPAEGADDQTQAEEPAEVESEDTGATPPRDGEIAAADIAEAAEDALEPQLGARPEVDCGEVNYVPEDGRIVYCTMIDPDSGEEYSATVTFTGVEGDQWQVLVEVPDYP